MPFLVPSGLQQTPKGNPRHLPHGRGVWGKCGGRFRAHSLSIFRHNFSVSGAQMLHFHVKLTKKCSKWTATVATHAASVWQMSRLVVWGLLHTRMNREGHQKGTQLREGVWGRDGASRTCRSAGGFVLEVQNRILMYVKFND